MFRNIEVISGRMRISHRHTHTHTKAYSSSSLVSAAWSCDGWQSFYIISITSLHSEKPDTRIGDLQEPGNVALGRDSKQTIDQCRNILQ